MDRLDDLMREALDAIMPAERHRVRQALCDELDRMGYRPTGWVDPPVLR